MTKIQRERLNQIKEALIQLSKSADPEAAHAEADGLLEEALIILGQAEIVEAFKNITKWYA